MHIDPSHDHLIGGDVEPSASVNLTMADPTKADKKLAEAIAETVAGTNAHMRRSRVHVIMDSRTFAIKDPDPNLPDGEIDEEEAKAEDHMEGEVKRALGYFNADVIAVVHANVDAIASHQTETTFPKIQVKDTVTNTQTTNTTASTPTSAEPGAAANTGGSLTANAPATGGGGTTSDSKTEDTKSQAFPDQKVIESSKPAGLATAISATVSVPASYFQTLLKNRSHSDKDPDPADVDKEFAAQRSELLAKVMHAIALNDEKAISVDMYYDTPLMMAVGRQLQLRWRISFITDDACPWWSREGNLPSAALAIVSLFMVSSMG